MDKMAGYKNQKYMKTVFYHLLVGIVGFFMIYPLIWMVFSSFKPSADVRTTAHILIPQKFVLENYINGWKGFGGVDFGVFFRNSLIISILSTIGGVASSVLVAYGFARIKFRGRNFWFVCMMLTLMLPQQVIMIPQFIIFRTLNWVNTFKPLIVPEFLSKPFFIFLIMQFIKGIPTELDQAAKIDGCGRYMIFYKIILPLVTPALITSAIFAFYWKWDDFLGALLYLNKPSLYTLSLALRMFADPAAVTDWGAMFAMCTLSLLPVFVIFISLQKYIVEGISTSGLKG
jgi:multiple sugar transport system permease protein